MVINAETKPIQFFLGRQVILDFFVAPERLASLLHIWIIVIDLRRIAQVNHFTPCGIPAYEVRSIRLVAAVTSAPLNVRYCMVCDSFAVGTFTRRFVALFRVAQSTN